MLIKMEWMGKNEKHGVDEWQFRAFSESTHTLVTHCFYGF